ncbi:hypothetical protein FRC12_008576 [Ceratobasidium sp. 428]|nr:hypothetical protein FRC12_008576 [Ceratobasidium sp. 428]
MSQPNAPLRIELQLTPDLDIDDLPDGPLYCVYEGPFPGVWKEYKPSVLQQRNKVPGASFCLTWSRQEALWVMKHKKSLATLLKQDGSYALYKVLIKLFGTWDNVIVGPQLREKANAQADPIPPTLPLDKNGIPMLVTEVEQPSQPSSQTSQIASPQSSQGSLSQASMSYSFNYPGTMTSPAKSSSFKAPQPKHSYNKFSPLASPPGQDRSRSKMSTPKLTPQQEQFRRDAAQLAADQCLEKLQWLGDINPQTELIAIDLLTESLWRRQIELLQQAHDRPASESAVEETLYDSDGNDFMNAPGPSSRSSQSSHSRYTRPSRFM